MTIEEKYTMQRNDAAERLNIDISPVQDAVCIYLGYFTGESLTVARAIKDLKPEITVLGHTIGTSVSFILEGNKLIQSGSSVKPIYNLQENNGIWTRFHGNYGNFKGVSGNKKLTSMILRNAGIQVPREIILDWQDYEPKEKETVLISRDQEEKVTRKRTQQVREFCRSLGKGKKVVIKPIDGCGGKNVFMCGYDEITYELLNSDELSVEGTVLVQEKIDSTPIFDELGNRKDWNVRVLTTTDKNGNIIVAGITGRIDADGGPVNRSISAENISLFDISVLGQWKQGEYAKIKKKIEDTAVKSVEAMLKKIKSKHLLESQDLAGVDIIIGEDMEPYVIEVNDSGSGCLYELMCLEGIQSIYPIADAIIRKTLAGDNFLKIGDAFKEKFGELAGRLTRLILEIDIGLEETDGDFELTAFTEKGKSFLDMFECIEQLKLEELK